MTTKQTLAGMLALVVAAAPLVAAAGCKLLKKGEETKPATAAPATAVPPPPPPTTTAAASEGDVKTDYPNMIPQRETVRLLRNFTVYAAADPNSRKITGLAVGTLVNLKASYGGEWMLIDWPSGVGQLSPGWIQVRLVDNRVQKVETPVDAGVADAAAPVVDAGAPVDAGTTAAVDAGKPEEKADAGHKRPVFKIRLPKATK
ncbi:MAG: hypothetical protein HY744_03520 [Deltaproteobacteria bacterium]|nr:hypothetical protein [Deltaproteobacteria bacterium]